jgi:hypothetical protein
LASPAGSLGWQMDLSTKTGSQPAIKKWFFAVFSGCLSRRGAEALRFLDFHPEFLRIPVSQREMPISFFLSLRLSVSARVYFSDIRLLETARRHQKISQKKSTRQKQNPQGRSASHFENCRH